SPTHPIIEKRGTGTSESLNGSEGYTFTLDKIYGPKTETKDLYNGTIQSVIQTCVREGYNATVFAYGQTGSGKTYTMMGNPNDDENLGLVPRSIQEVFNVISQDILDRQYLLRISYLEIYNETLKDLLAGSSNNNKLMIHENDKGKVYVNGLREVIVNDPIQVLDNLKKGEKLRHFGMTDWNERSSRSHTVFTMTIESRSKDPSNKSTQLSQLNLIDLAGSESSATNLERRKEGTFINKSLLSLSNVISKLSSNNENHHHIPYRDSKLTRLLQTSLSGNAKIVVVCTLNCSDDSVVESLSTLRFARRAKMVITKAERGTVSSHFNQFYFFHTLIRSFKLLDNRSKISFITSLPTRNSITEISIIKNSTFGIARSKFK
ncbi:hypothetical protein CROQUDRAFT_48663, partial [Cronartium quercuum f. sp. fusiforme G11]